MATNNPSAYTASNDANYAKLEDVLSKRIGNINVLANEILLSRSSQVPLDNVLQDNQWQRQAFITGGMTTDKTDPTKLVTSLNLENVDEVNREYSSAYFKYTDSSIGGNFCINPPPAFTRYADIKDKGIRRNATGTTLEYQVEDIGMGRYYSEAIDDNSQVIHMRFGVPQYNSLTRFFTGFYNSSASKMARTGRMDDGILGTFLEAAGNVVKIAIFPLLIIPLAIQEMGEAIRFFLYWPASKFYTLKPAMPLYWSAVSSMVNQIAVNKGVTKPLERKKEDGVIGRKHVFASGEMSMFHSIMGDEFDDDGRINVKAIATKAKRLEMNHRVAMQDMYIGLDKSSPEQWRGRIKTFMEDGGGLDSEPPTEYQKMGKTMEAYIQRWISCDFLGSVKNAISSAVDGAAAAAEEKKDSDTEKMIRSDGVVKKPPAGWMDFFLAEKADGSAWASFRVDYTGAASESFNTSTGESTLAQKINDASNSARNIRINFADGNFDSAGIIKTAIDGATSVVQGVANTFGIGGLAMFAGNGLIDIPKHWESSTASLTKSSFTMTLISPYGNAVSQMFNIYVPLCMILAGALPISTGKQSYTSPFMCELYDRGRNIIRLGMIDSVSIQRGTSNLGFNNEGLPMAIDVTFDVLNMSTIISMPIIQGFSFMNPLEGIFDNENAFSDYLMTLSSLSLRDSEQRWPILERQINQKIADIKTTFSASSIAMNFSNLLGGNAINSIFRGSGTRSASEG
jgi:hypothetical protein